MNPTESPNDHAIYRKIGWHSIPLLLAAYVVAFLDRINIGYAQLQMKATLAFSNATYALGVGIFFISPSPARRHDLQQDLHDEPVPAGRIHRADGRSAASPVLQAA